MTLPIKLLTKKASTIVDRSIAHFDRNNRIRTIEFEEADKIILKLVEILYFYSVLLGAKVACDTDNYIITYDWKSIILLGAASDPGINASIP